MSRALTLLLALLAASPALAQMRNIGPGVADRTNTLTRGGGDEIIYGGVLETGLAADLNARRGSIRSHGDLNTQNLLGGYLLLPYGLALNGVLRLDQTPANPDGRGQLFRNQALWADELYLTWSHGVLDLFGGKIHPRFGSAWDRGPGLYGTDFGREYELSEKLGVGARLWLSDLLGVSGLAGSHNLQVESFETDRSILSAGLGSARWPDSAGTLRWRNRAAFGGADNTSFVGGTVASLAGFGLPMPRGLAGYTLSYSARRPGQDAVAAGRAGTEQAGSAGFFWTLPLPQRLTAVPFVEYVVKEPANGFTGQRADWLTAGLDLRRVPWTLSYAFQGNHNTDRLAQTRAGRTEQSVSVSYDLYFIAPTPMLRAASVTLGWRRLREDGISSNGVGGLLGWNWKF